MLGNIIPQGHLDFANNMQGAMGSMWQVNQANQQAALARQALGGGRGGQGGGARQPGLWDAFMGFNISDPSQAAAYGNVRNQQRNFRNQDFEDQWRQNQMMLDQRYADFQRKIPMLSRLFGFGGGGSFGSGPIGYTTNFGAYGNA